MLEVRVSSAELAQASSTRHATVTCWACKSPPETCPGPPWAGVESAPTPLAGGEALVTLTGLDNGIEVRVICRCTNSKGEGAFSEPSLTTMAGVAVQRKLMVDDHISLTSMRLRLADELGMSASAVTLILADTDPEGDRRQRRRLLEPIPQRTSVRVRNMSHHSQQSRPSSHAADHVVTNSTVHLDSLMESGGRSGVARGTRRAQAAAMRAVWAIVAVRSSNDPVISNVTSVLDRLVDKPGVTSTDPTLVISDPQDTNTYLRALTIAYFNSSVSSAHDAVAELSPSFVPYDPLSASAAEEDFIFETTVTGPSFTVRAETHSSSAKISAKNSRGTAVNVKIDGEAVDFDPVLPVTVVVTLRVIAFDGSERHYVLSVRPDPLPCLVHGTPSSCGGGVCDSLRGRCVCKHGFVSAGCNEFFCPGNPECGGRSRGVCSLVGTDGDASDAESGMPLCNCTPPYYGTACELLRCPAECSSHGHCDKATGSCSCYAGFTGPDCGKIGLRLVPLTNCVEITLIWGISGYDLSNVTAPAYDGNFDLLDAESQAWIYDTCVSARADPLLAVRKEQPCWIDVWRKFVFARGGQFPVRNRTLASEALQAFFALSSTINAGFEADVGTEGQRHAGRPTYARVRFLVNEERSASVSSLARLRDTWEAFVSGGGPLRSKAPRSAAGGLITSPSWTKMEVETMIVGSTTEGVVLSIGISLASVLMFTGNWIIAVYVVLNIILVVCVLFAFMFYVMGYAFGAVEAIGSIIFVGMSIDYCLHLAHGYHVVFASDRQTKVQSVLTQLGPSILGGAFTTLSSTVFLLPCKIILFAQLGAMLFANALFSVLFTFLFLAPLLMVAGPLRNQGEVCCCDWRCLVCGYRRQRDSEEQRLFVKRPVARKQVGGAATDIALCDALAMLQGHMLARDLGVSSIGSAKLSQLYEAACAAGITENSPELLLARRQIDCAEAAETSQTQVSFSTTKGVLEQSATTDQHFASPCHGTFGVEEGASGSSGARNSANDNAATVAGADALAPVLLSSLARASRGHSDDVSKSFKDSSSGFIGVHGAGDDGKIRKNGGIGSIGGGGGGGGGNNTVTESADMCREDAGLSVSLPSDRRRQGGSRRGEGSVIGRTTCSRRDLGNEPVASAQRSRTDVRHRHGSRASISGDDDVAQGGHQWRRSCRRRQRDRSERGSGAGDDVLETSARLESGMEETDGFPKSFEPPSPLHPAMSPSRQAGRKSSAVRSESEDVVLFGGGARSTPAAGRSSGGSVGSGGGGKCRDGRGTSKVRIGPRVKSSSRGTRRHVPSGERLDQSVDDTDSLELGKLR
eukprot:TRINITY_DN50638_c0_g1_i1.p1 TRINITY_DN50638_c0_g1~~TRINITY_DN50638_c0_g1_i1.p1  ORF type:complete len:1323 (+),score=185.33 TRINITY_DN50638_c0_g1_i1:33-3971(+)